MIHEATELMGEGSWRFSRERKCGDKVLALAPFLFLFPSQFIRTSICTSLALVSPAIRYGIIPAKVISARAWLRSICVYKCMTHIGMHYRRELK